MSSTHPESSNHTLAVGLGVGVPLGVALLLVVAWAFWERSKRAQSSRQYAGPADIDGSGLQYSDELKNGTKQQSFGGELDGQRAHELQ
jgi:hypothetical protein